MTQKYVIASGNQGKVAELRALLEHLPIELISQSEFNIPEAEETGTTFHENAIIKARHAAQLTGLPSIADDSGLSVDALNGAPGVYSARYAGKDATNEQRIQKLLDELKKLGDVDRSAHFHCVIAVMQSAEDPAPLVCHGAWHGDILHSPIGDKGFGYDPVFYAPEHQCSAAELDPEYKNRISHRGRAIEKLLTDLEELIAA